MAYRLLLDREPENESVCELKCEDAPTVDDLLRQFLASREFAEKHPDLAKGAAADHLPIDVQVSVSEDELSKLFDHVQTAWKHLGDTEPHWSVLVSSKFKQKNIEKTEDEFYASGVQQVDSFLLAAKRNGLSINRGSVMDFGCGVGRITHAFSPHFEQVYGVDISSAHIRVADAYYNRQAGRLDNVESLHLTSILKLDELPMVDAIFTLIVLQHNPPPVMAYILEKLLSKLKPGGVASFQLPTYARGYSFNASSYLANAKGRKVIEMHVLPQREVHGIIRRTGCEVVEVTKDFSTGSFGCSFQFLVHKP